MEKQLFYRMKGSGPALVLLHPVGLDHSFWGPLLDQAAEMFTVIAVDLMGHGRSGVVSADRPIGEYANDVRDLLNRLDIEKAGVLGLSFGGMIAQEFAVSHPDRLSFLVVGACGSRIPVEVSAAVRARGEVAADIGMAAVVETTLERWFTPAFMGSPAVARVREQLLANDPRGWAAGWSAISSFDAASRLAGVSVPSMVIAAELDAGTAVPATRAIADAIPGARFTLLAGAPHMMQIECADRFTDQVIDFLRDR